MKKSFKRFINTILPVITILFACIPTNNGQSKSPDSQYSSSFDSSLGSNASFSDDNEISYKDAEIDKNLALKTLHEKINQTFNAVEAWIKSLTNKILVLSTTERTRTINKQIEETIDYFRSFIQEQVVEQQWFNYANAVNPSLQKALKTQAYTLMQTGLTNLKTIEPYARKTDLPPKQRVNLDDTNNAIKTEQLMAQKLTDSLCIQIDALKAVIEKQSILIQAIIENALKPQECFQELELMKKHFKIMQDWKDSMLLSDRQQTQVNTCSEKFTNQTRIIIASTEKAIAHYNQEWIAMAERIKKDQEQAAKQKAEEIRRQAQEQAEKGKDNHTKLPPPTAEQAEWLKKENERYMREQEYKRAEQERFYQKQYQIAQEEAALKLNDAYSTLELTQSADKETIRRAYKQLALKWHPDKNKNASAEAKFKAIQDAYQSIEADRSRKNQW